MKRFILFSTPDRDFDEVLALMFPSEISRKVFAYMPANGALEKPQYRALWQNIAQKHGAEFRLIDNSKRSDTEREKLLTSTILLITGGNTFGLLDNLHRSGLFSAIQKFAQKDEFVVAGWSAGALIQTPSIEICNLEGFDENLVGITDLRGLDFVPFEVFPHYTKTLEGALNLYRQKTTREVRPMMDGEHIVIDH